MYCTFYCLHHSMMHAHNDVVSILYHFEKWSFVVMIVALRMVMLMELLCGP